MNTLRRIRDAGTQITIKDKTIFAMTPTFGIVPVRLRTNRKYFIYTTFASRRQYALLGRRIKDVIILASTLSGATRWAVEEVNWMTVSSTR